MQAPAIHEFTPEVQGFRIDETEPMRTECLPTSEFTLIGTAEKSIYLKDQKDKPSANMLKNRFSILELAHAADESSSDNLIEVFPI